MADGKIEIDLELNDSGAQQKAKKSGDEIAKGVESGLKNVGKSAESAAKDTEKSFKSAADSAKSSFSDVGSAAKNGFGDVGDAAKTAAGDASSAFENVPSDASGAFADVGDAAKNGFDSIPDAAQSAAGDAAGSFDQISDAAETAGDNVHESLGIKTIAAGNLVADAFAAAAQKVIELGKEALNAGMEFDQSMAQVAATMGVTVDEVDNLRSFAQQMGETTAFSASQSADALNYMALAGYDAETSMRVLPTVLNLAAAGSMDLASASDMVTDAQSALGLSVEEAEVMVDQMAKTSSKTNTSVAQLGDAFLTVGGTAKNLKGGTKELAQMLGLLADNGVKGSEGGTALRNVILSLSAPTDKAAASIEKLGLQVFDAEGNMRSMPDIFNDMNAAMATMTQQDRTNILNDIFNKVDLKSVNALLGTSADRFDEVAAAIDNSAGAAQAMADTQLDNLAGDVTLLESATEGFYIAVSDALTPALRGLTQFGTNTLMPFLTEGVKNFDKIAPAVLAAVTAIVVMATKGKAVSALNSVFGKLTLSVNGTEKAFKSLTVTQKATAIATKGVGVAMNALKAAAPILAITALVEAGTLLYQAWKSNQEQTQKFTAATKGLTTAASGTAVKINQETGAVESLGNAYKDINLDEIIEKHSQLAQTLSDSAQEAATSQSLLSQYQSTISELADGTNLTEEQVAELNIAVNGVNEALGTSYQVIQNDAGAYKIMADGVEVAKDTIYELIEAQKRQIQAEADMEGYKGVYSQLAEDNEKLATAKKNAADASEELRAAEEALQRADPSADVQELQAAYDLAANKVEKYNKEVADMEEIQGSSQSAMNKYTERLKLNEMAAQDGASAIIKAADANLAYRSAVQGSDVDLIGFTKALEELGFTADEVANMSQDDAMRLASAWRSGYDEFEDATNKVIKRVPDQLKNMGKKAKETGGKTGEELADGLKSKTSDILRAVEGIGNSVTNKFSTIDATKEGANTSNSFASGIASGKGSANNAASSVGSSAASQYGGHNGEAFNSGSYLTQGFINGMNSMKSAAQRVASNIASAALAALRKTGGEGSPWKTTYQSGVWAAQGLINGIKKQKANAKKNASELSQTIVDGATKKINNLKGVYNISLDYEIGYWKKVKSSTKKGSDAWYKAWGNIVALQKQKAQQINDNYNKIISNAQTWLERYKLTHNVSLKYELNYWNKRIKQVKKGSDAYYTALKYSKDAEQAYYDGIISDANNYVSRQKRLYDMTYQQEANYWQKVLKKVKKGSAQYKEAYDNYLEAKKNAAQEVKEKNADLLDAEQDFVNKLRDIQQQLTDDIQAARDAYKEAVADRKQTILSDLNTFEIYRKKMTISGEKLIENIKSQANAAKDYEKAMKTLEGRIGKGDLYNEIADMGMEGLRYAESLNQMTAAQLKEFTKLYNERNAAAQREATRQSKDLLDETNSTIKKLNDQAAKDIKSAANDLKSTAADLGTTLSKTVANMAKNVKASANSINSSINSAINSLKKLDSRVSTTSTNSTRSYVSQPSQEPLMPVPSVYNGREIIRDSNGGIEGVSLLSTDFIGSARQTEVSLIKGMEALTMAMKDSRAIGGDTFNEQNISFNVPVSSPDEIARTMRMQQYYGLAGEY